MREDERVERRIPERAYVSLLDADGRPARLRAPSPLPRGAAACRGRDLCFVIGGPFGLELERADHRLSLGPMTLPHQLARVVLLEQLFRAHKILARRALPPLMARAHASSGAFLRRLRDARARARAASSRAGTHRVRRSPRTSASGSRLPAGRSTPSPPSARIPTPETVAGQIVKVAADRAGRRYALLRPGDGDGGLRRRPPRRPARRAPRPARPSTPPATTTSSAASAASAARSPATCARPGRATSSSTHNPENRELAAGRRRALHRGRGRPTTRSCAPPGSMRARGVIACVDSDADNIFITLTARELRPDIAIVARAASEDVGVQAAARRARRASSRPTRPAARRWRASR